MKKIITLCFIFLIVLSSTSAYALDKGTLKWLKEQNQNGWYFDKDTQQNYYFKNGEVVKNDWINKNGWYHLNEDGTMDKGWNKINNNWYYFTSSGTMKTGWYKDGSNWYYLDLDGSMAHDTYIGSYYINSNGVWVS